MAKKKRFRRDLVKSTLWAVIAIVGAVYFGNMFFGKSSLETLMSLQITKEQLQRRIAYLKGQNAVAQKDYFELQGLYPNDKR